MTVEITSGKLYGPKKLFLNYQYVINGGSNDSCSVKSGAPVHDDLRAKFTQLIPHFAFICDEIEESEDLATACKDYTELDEFSALFNKLSAFKVTGFSMGGGKDDVSITITGSKKLKSGKLLSLVTPAIKWSDAYTYLPDLQLAAGRLQSEIILYMDGKIAPDLQGELPYPGGDEDDNEDLNED